MRNTDIEGGETTLIREIVQVLKNKGHKQVSLSVHKVNYVDSLC